MITKSSPNLSHFCSYYSQWWLSTSQIPPHHCRQHTWDNTTHINALSSASASALTITRKCAIIMVFTEMTTNIPTTILSPTISQFHSTRRQRESIWKPTCHARKAALTTIQNHTSKCTIIYSHSYNLAYNCHIHLSLRNFMKPIAIQLGDNHTVTVSHHGLVNVSQEYKVNNLFTPAFWFSLPPIN